MEPRKLSRRRFEELRLSAHRRYLERRAYEERRVWQIWVDGPVALVRGWAGAMIVQMPARALRDPHALSKRGF